MPNEREAIRILKLLHSAEHLRQLRGLDRVCAQWLFSFLADVEEIAVLAAERGDGVPNQLEDEIVHRDVFGRIADWLGGRCDRCEAIEQLTSYLGGLVGQYSTVALNVVAENWLAGLFREVSTWDLAPDLFAEIEKDERRHAAMSLGMDRPPQDEICSIVQHVEKYMGLIARSPEFAIPLRWFGGAAGLGRIAIANVRDHEKACVALECQPSSMIADIEKLGRGLVMTSNMEPEIWQLNRWEKSRMVLWPGQIPIIPLKIRVPVVASTDTDLEATVVRAVARTLECMPLLNRVYRNDCLFGPKTVKVALRRYHDAAVGLLGTIYLDDVGSLMMYQLLDRIRHRVAKMREATYQELLPIPAPLLPALPPSRAAVTVTMCASFDIEEGYAPLSPVEGASISVAVASVRDGMCAIGIQVDHRVADGREACAFASNLQAQLVLSARRVAGV